MFLHPGRLPRPRWWRRDHSSWAGYEADADCVTGLVYSGVLMLGGQVDVRMAASKFRVESELFGKSPGWPRNQPPTSAQTAYVNPPRHPLFPPFHPPSHSSSGVHIFLPLLFAACHPAPSSSPTPSIPHPSLAPLLPCTKHSPGSEHSYLYEISTGNPPLVQPYAPYKRSM